MHALPLGYVLEKTLNKLFKLNTIDLLIKLKNILINNPPVRIRL